MAKWYEKAVFYHIYPLGLCGCAKENKEEVKEEHFDKLNEWTAHIKNLGCTAIYIGPLFQSGTHGYDTYDYKKVDQRIGTNEDFKEYVKQCHEEGIKVIVDGVFNHTGRGFFAFCDIKENRENSSYKDWYCNVNFGGNNEYNDGFSYDNWAGYNILPKLNLQNKTVRDYLFDVIRFWISEFDIDGIRLDAADVLDFTFMKEMRQAVSTAKEDFWLMGEVIHGNYSRWANGETLHSVTNYELHKGLYSGHNDHNYFEIAHSVKRLQGICGKTLLYTFIDNHDVERIYNKLKNKAHLYPVYMLLFTLPGIPSIYYGSEFAIEGAKTKWSDDALRPSLSLSDFMEDGKYKKEYLPLITWIQTLGRIKAEHPELTEGTYKELLLTNQHFAFERSLSTGTIITVVNNDEKAASLTIPVSASSAKAVDLFSDNEIEIDNGKILVDIESCSGKILYISC